MEINSASVLISYKQFFWSQFISYCRFCCSIWDLIIVYELIKTRQSAEKNANYGKEYLVDKCENGKIISSGNYRVHYTKLSSKFLIGPKWHHIQKLSIQYFVLLPLYWGYYAFLSSSYIAKRIDSLSFSFGFKWGTLIPVD